MLLDSTVRPSSLKAPPFGQRTGSGYLRAQAGLQHLWWSSARAQRTGPGKQFTYSTKDTCAALSAHSALPCLHWQSLACSSQRSAALLRYNHRYAVRAQDAVVHHGFRFYVANLRASTLVEVRLHAAELRPAKRPRLSEDGVRAVPPAALSAAALEPESPPSAHVPDAHHAAHAPFGLLRVHGLPPADNACGPCSIQPLSIPACMIPGRGCNLACMAHFCWGDVAELCCMHSAGE